MEPHELQRELRPIGCREQKHVLVAERPHDIACVVGGAERREVLRLYSGRAQSRNDLVRRVDERLDRLVAGCAPVIRERPENWRRTTRAVAEAPLIERDDRPVAQRELSDGGGEKHLPNDVDGGLTRPAS